MTIHVHVKPNSKTDAIHIDSDRSIRIKICAAPVEGRANNYLVKYLSGIFKIPASKIQIIKGHNNSYKTISLSVDKDYGHKIMDNLKNNTGQ